VSVGTVIVDTTVKDFDGSMLHLKFIYFPNSVHRLAFKMEHGVSIIQSVPSSVEEPCIFGRTQMSRCLQPFHLKTETDSVFERLCSVQNA
jgi:hypothetical protein